jgi:hypothetical protein
MTPTQIIYLVLYMIYGSAKLQNSNMGIFSIIITYWYPVFQLLDEPWI